MSCVRVCLCVCVGVCIHAVRLQQALQLVWGQVLQGDTVALQQGADPLQAVI